jgi:excisionase family DNA binding protein
MEATEQIEPEAVKELQKLFYCAREAMDIGNGGARAMVQLEKLGYDIKEAATRLGMSTKSVRRQIAKGNLRRCIKFGRIRIPRKDVDNFFEKYSSFAA